MSHYVHPSAVVDAGAVIGAGTKVWHFSHVMPGARVGERCSFGQNCYVGNVVIGDNCRVQNNVSLYDGVHLADDVFVGPSAVFTNVVNPRSAFPRKDEYRETRVGRGASIGANATIVCGNELGEYCLIAAGAVVTKSVPSYALMAGVPARRIGWVSRAGEILDKSLVCPRTGERYREHDGALEWIEGAV